MLTGGGAAAGMAALAGDGEEGDIVELLLTKGKISRGNGSSCPRTCRDANGDGGPHRGDGAALAGRAAEAKTWCYMGYRSRWRRDRRGEWQRVTRLVRCRLYIGGRGRGEPMAG